jgi:hypothetical protein
MFQAEERLNRFRNNNQRNINNNMLTPRDTRTIEPDLKTLILTEVLKRVPATFINSFNSHLVNTELLSNEKKESLELGYSAQDCFLIIIFGLLYHKVATTDYQI